MSSSDGSKLNRDAIFSGLKEKAKRLDVLFTKLKQMQSGEVVLQPTTTLHRIHGDVQALEEEMTSHLKSLTEQRRQMEKTVSLVKITTRLKRAHLDKIKAKIGEYTCIEDGKAESGGILPNSKSTVSSSISKQSSSNNSPSASKVGSVRSLTSAKSTTHSSTCKSSSTSKSSNHSVKSSHGEIKSSSHESVSSTPLKSMEYRAPPCEPEDVKQPVSAPATPVRSPSAGGLEEIPTPKLTDFLSLDDMYFMLDKENLITKSSKRSSSKKGSRCTTPKSVNAKIKRSIFSSATKANWSDDEGHLATPTMPVLQPMTPFVSKLPKQTCTSRICMVEAEEYHSRVEDQIRKLVSLDLINRVIDSVALLFELSPGEAVKKEDILKLVKPIANVKTNLCYSILIKLKRLKSESGDMILPVYGSDST